MEEVRDGLNSPLEEFRKINAWAAGATPSAAFRRSALGISEPGAASGSPLSAKNMAEQRLDTGGVGYTPMA